MAKKEHTINDVYETLNEFFGFVKDQFGKVEGRFEKMDGRFEKNERTLKLMNDQVVSIGKEIKDLKETTEKMHGRLRNVEQDVLTIREDVETLGKIAGRDSTVIKSHGRRITTLERSRYL